MSSTCMQTFDLEALQGHPQSAKVPHVVPICPLLLVLEVWHVKPTFRKSWAGNLLMWSDLTLGPSFKAKINIAYNSLILGPRHLQCETNLYFSEFRPPSGILAEMENVVYLENHER